MKLPTLLLIGLLAISGTALAGADVHAGVTVNDESHTLDATVGDDGSASVLVDGEPVGVPSAP